MHLQAHDYIISIVDFFIYFYFYLFVVVGLRKNYELLMIAFI